VRKPLRGEIRSFRGQIFSSTVIRISLEARAHPLRQFPAYFDGYRHQGEFSGFYSSYCDCPKTIVSDKDSRFMSTFWQDLFRLVGTTLTPSTSYHPQTDGQTEIVNKWVEGYLRNYVAGQQKAWVKWLHLGE
jgi:hypothetical protein